VGGSVAIAGVGALVVYSIVHANTVATSAANLGGTSPLLPPLKEARVSL